jgi:hypothetical protein
MISKGFLEKSLPKIQAGLKKAYQKGFLEKSLCNKYEMYHIFHMYC